ncbi:hypothetical protein [Aequorivita viscosa]|uniref:Uncharacterized protein n=1 Tax=Aequorivita viscosa TaxID=797419 RepID=A0A1M6M4Y4_9FLAO|nr:hypothetical protein [Aequorivita viscosa]SDX30430.1 hypothetical protein SAMN05216556_1244 [Aequorivita viscosa]SHJ78486.1 hypothetical protein SAMN04487908_12556 [Aequorivita viscosa]
MDNYRISIFGGIVFGVLPNLPVKDIVVTMCMATFGTITSFIVTLLLRWIGKWFVRR